MSVRSTHDDAVSVVHRLRSAGHEAYFAGGCVRDALMGLEPTDFDIATDAPPTKVRALFPRTQAVGAAFGVILVRHGNSQIEVATFRTDGRYVDGRRPEAVLFTTAEEDAKRRDFTINGMFFDPVEEKVIDYVGGQDDLKSGVLRAIGDPDARFSEDHLRVLRAVRFAARFKLLIEPVTRAALARHIQHLTRISPERIAEELRLMLTPPSRTAAWAMLSEIGFSTILFRSSDTPLTPSAKPVFDFIRRRDRVPFALALAAAWLDSSDRMIEPAAVQKIVAGLRQTLKISNEESESLKGALDGLRFLTADASHSVAQLKRFLAQPTAQLARDLLAATPGHEAVEGRLADLEQTDYAPVPLITGDDLTAAGLTPGKSFKLALDGAYDAQLENRITTKKQGLELAMKIARAV